MLTLLLILLLIILPLAVIVMIISAILRRSKTSEPSSIKIFEKSTRSIYIYTVLICLLFVIIIGAVYLFSSALNLAFPEKTEDFSYYTNDDVDYKDDIYDDGYTYGYSNKSNRNRNENIVGIFTATAMLISSIPLFIYYSKASRKIND